MKRRRCKLKTQHDPHEWDPIPYPASGTRKGGGTAQRGVIVITSFWCPGTVKA